MPYQEIREDGLPLGNGMVESACKQFRARLAGPGMRCKRTGAQRMLPIRAAAMSRQFDTWWQSVAALPSSEMHLLAYAGQRETDGVEQRGMTDHPLLQPHRSRTWELRTQMHPRRERSIGTVPQVSRAYRPKRVAPPAP